jgi:hypothetical protein
MAVLLACTLAVYGGANSFWLYLSTGDWLRLGPASYAADFTNPVTLPDLFERTLNVLTHPWMIVIGGMVLGVVIFAPIIVAVLHRLWIALMLAAVALLVGHAPAMTLALVAGCILASKTRLRRTAPFLAAVIGALPLVLYLYLFSSAGSTSVAVPPIQRWALKAPYLIAMMSAVLAFAIALGLARLTRYRPGLIWPVLAVMLAVPGGLFVWKIGRAELEYQLIAGPLAEGDAVFEPVDRRTWMASFGGQGLLGKGLEARAKADLAEKTTALHERCRRFLARFPASPRAPAVQWVLAQCLGLQLDHPALEQGWIKSTAAYLAPIPNEEDPQLTAARKLELRKEAAGEANEVWEALRRNYPDTPQAALASWRLAELALRRLAWPGATPEEANQRVRHADDLLQAAQKGVQSVLDDGRRRQQASRGDEVFQGAPSVPPSDYYEQALFRIRWLRWLMTHNGVLTHPRSAEALGAYLEVNAYGIGHDAYTQQLCELAGRYEGTPLATNLQVAVALTETDVERRADQLTLLAEQVKDVDAAVEGAYELGLLVLQCPSLQNRPDVKPPAEYFRLVRDTPGNPWKELAAERLRILAVSSRSATRPSTRSTLSSRGRPEFPFALRAWKGVSGT